MHGPYWVIYAPRSAGKPRQRFVGSDEKKREIEAAWELVTAELAAAEETPAVRALRELEALAGRGPRLARGAVEAPRAVAGRPK